MNIYHHPGGTSSSNGVVAPELACAPAGSNTPGYAIHPESLGDIEPAADEAVLDVGVSSTSSTRVNGSGSVF